MVHVLSENVKHMYYLKFCTSFVDGKIYKCTMMQCNTIVALSEPIILGEAREPTHFLPIALLPATFGHISISNFIGNVLNNI